MRTISARAVWVMVSALALGGCSDNLKSWLSDGTGSIDPPNRPAPAVEDVHLLPGVPNGFECPIVPNGFDPAGSIYRLDKSGTFYRVTAYGEEPAILAMKGYRRDIRITDYTFSDEQKSSAGVSFALLKNVIPGLSASASAEAKKSLKVDVKVSDMRAESIDDQVADHILERFRADVKPKAGSKYFLVRETIRAGAISYGITREDLKKLGAEAQVAALGGGNANVTIKDQNGLVAISQTFTPDRVPVCIKAAEIVIEPVRSGAAATVTLKDTRDTELPAIKKIGSDEAKPTSGTTASLPAAQPSSPSSDAAARP